MDRLLEKLVRAKVRQRLGGRLRYFVLVAHHLTLISAGFF